MTKPVLLSLLETDYAHFKSRLVRRLGSENVADDVLQETWIRVHHLDQPANISNPRSYLFRMALNAHADLHRGKNRALRADEVDILLANAIDTLDPSQIAESRADMRALDLALASLTERQRRIFVLSQVDGQSEQGIAITFGISVRTVRKELASSLDHCRKVLDRPKKNTSRP